MNKKALSLLLLPVFALTLSSCREEISTLYKGGEYTSSNLKENYYTGYPDNLKKLDFPKLSFDLKDSQFTATSSTFSQVMNTSLSFIDVSVTGFNNGDR